MHDLNTINRLNEEAHAEAIEKERKAGKVVVAHYEGATLLTHKSFPCVEDALTYQAAANKLAGETRRVLLPASIPAHT